MKHYAMVLQNRVIDIVESEMIPYYPPDPQGNPVTAVACEGAVVLGMTYDAEMGIFSEPIYVPPADPPLTEAEQAVLQTAINTEYLLYLMESTI